VNVNNSGLTLLSYADKSPQGALPVGRSLLGRLWRTCPGPIWPDLAERPMLAVVAGLQIRTVKTMRQQASVLVFFQWLHRTRNSFTDPALRLVDVEHHRFELMRLTILLVAHVHCPVFVRHVARCRSYDSTI
jgi:hypothetical protein